MKVRYYRHRCPSCHADVQYLYDARNHLRCPSCFWDPQADPNNIQEYEKYIPETGDCSSSSFNTSALAEVIVYDDEGGCDSAFIKDLAVLIEKGYVGLCQDCGHFWRDHIIKCDHPRWSNDLDRKCPCENKFVPFWKDLGQAMRDHDVIHDNFNTGFFEPTTPEDRIRGYTL